MFLSGTTCLFWLLFFLLKDEEVIVLKDKYPVAEHHILVLPRRHIKNAKFVQTEDIDLCN